MPRGDGTHPGVQVDPDVKDPRKKETSATPGANSAWHLQAVFLWKSNPVSSKLWVFGNYLVPDGSILWHLCELANNQVNSHSAFQASSSNFKMLEIAIHEPQYPATWLKSEYLGGYTKLQGSWQF